LTTALVERCLNAEMEHHIEEDRSALLAENASRNRRNGYSMKTIKGEFGEAEIAIPRDRNAAFEPVILAKGQTRVDGFDGKILSLYSRGMSVRDIQFLLSHLRFVELFTPPMRLNRSI
jgi:putative transposase